VNLARDKGVFLEITSRRGHSLTNGHVARLARSAGASLVLNTDTHLPEDLISREKALKVVLGAGLESTDFERMLANSRRLLSRLG
jgi:putative hydrolase